MDKFIKDTGKTYDLTPSYKLVKTLGASSYTIGTAIADIIDNSITAEATDIEVLFKFDNSDTQSSYVEIIDNGYGMTSYELENAMKFASKGVDDDRSDEDLGRYGIGMKTASLGCCNCLTVISKKKNEKITAKRMDQKFITDSASWNGQDLDDAPELSQYTFDHGTVVRWDNLNFVKNGENAKTFFYRNMDDVMHHLSLHFHRFIEKEKVVIKVNGNIIKPWNPTCTNYIMTNRISEKSIVYSGKKIILKGYLLPSREKITPTEELDIYRGNALRYQGLYVYRNDRLIIAGGWMNLRNIKTHQQNNPVRITIDIPSTLDSEFKVGFTKSGLELPQDVLKEIESFAKVCCSKASEAFKNRAKRVAAPGVNSNSQVWNIVQNSNGAKARINPDHPALKKYKEKLGSKDFKELLKLLSETVPNISTGKSNEIPRFTENEIRKMAKNIFLDELSQLDGKGMKTPKDILIKILNTSPFDEYMDVVQAMFEEEGLLK